MVLVAALYFNDLASQSSSTPDDGIGAYLPMGAMVMLLLAMRFIKKDDDLVRSMDRLR